MDWMIDVAMGLLMIAMIPQVIEAYKNRQTLAKRSKFFFVLTFTGNVFAFVWGILFAQYSIALLNLFYGVWSTMTLIFMFKYREKPKHLVPERDEKTKEWRWVSRDFVTKRTRVSSFLHRLLCKLGFHEYEILASLDPSWSTLRICWVCGKKQRRDPTTFRPIAFHYTYDKYEWIDI